MEAFTFSYPVTTHFGPGALQDALKVELKKFGKNVLFAYGSGSVKRNGIYDQVTALLREAGKTVTEFPGIMPNPTYEKALEGARLCREHHIDLILAVGGGSVSDCCKLAATQALTDENVWDLVMERHVIPKEALPLGVVVTAAGTGSEQNGGAVITNTEKMLKAGVWVPCSTPKFAILDPNLTLSVPLRQVMSGAFDTLSHAMETYFGRPEPLNVSDDISEAIMRNTIRNMRALRRDPMDLEARSELMWDAAMAENGILKIGKVTDFQAHQIEHQLGAYTDCNHGAGLAVIHPVFYRHIYRESIPKFKAFALHIWGIDPAGKSDEEIARLGVEALADFIREMGLPTTFRDMGISPDTDFRPMADTVKVTAGCCKRLSRAEFLEIYRECL